MALYLLLGVYLAYICWQARRAPEHGGRPAWPWYALVALGWPLAAAYFVICLIQIATRD